MCKFKDCKTKPTYGLVWKKPTHCANHKTPEMYDVINKQCKFKDCKTRPHYGLVWKKPTHCANHKTPEMYNVNDKQCEFKDCKTRPHYGLVWKKPTHCANHKTPEEIYSIKPKCKCKKYAFYGKDKILRCENHKESDDIDLVRSVCDICIEKFTPDKIKDGRCKYCSTRWKNGQVKEYDVINYVLKGNYDFIHNNTVKPGNCKSSGYRPDIIIKYSLFNVIIEIDENQHTGYKKMCESSVHKELTRLITIYENDFGGMPLIIIRFNPDKYKSPYQCSMTERFAVLKTLLHNLKNATELKSSLVCYYLFYDGYDRTLRQEPIIYNTSNNGFMVIEHKHPKYPEAEYIIQM